MHKITTECGALLSDFSISENEVFVELQTSTKRHGRKEFLKHIFSQSQINSMESNQSNKKAQTRHFVNGLVQKQVLKKYTKWCVKEFLFSCSLRRFLVFLIEMLSLVFVIDKVDEFRRPGTKNQKNSEPKTS